MRKLMMASMLIMLTTFAFAQKAPIRFGKPSMENLKKTSYDIDTTASAVILCNYGNFDAQRFVYVQTIRVKILKREGLTWGDWTFKSMSTANIRGRTFNLVDGKEVVDKLTKKSIFKEKLLNNVYVTKVTMPNVKVGSVIDIEVSYSGIPFNFYFQSTIPELYSELVMGSSNYIDFKKNYFGYVPFNIVESGRWITKNVPAFQSEPHMANKQNYLAHFEFDIQRTIIPGQLVKEYASSWQKVAEYLMDSKYFGDALKSNGHFFKLIGDSIKQVSKTDLDKVQAALARVHKIKWNEDNDVYSSSESGLRYIFAKGTGNSADINLSLISILRHSGIEASPVVFRTRNEGQLSLYNPTLMNLNYVMAYAKIGDKFYLLDGTNKNIPFPYLPKRCINGKGQLILPGNKTKWVSLSNNAISKKNEFYSMKLNEEGTLTGSVSHSLNGYYAISFRSDYHDLGSHDEFVKNRMSMNGKMEILKDTVMNVDDVKKPVVERSTESFKDQMIAVDSLAYLNLIPDKMTENPFKQEKRQFPIDFVYPFEKSGIVSITLPSNYKVVKMPKAVKYSLPDNEGSFLFQAGVQGNHITVIYKFKINKAMFLATKYPLLKGLYMQTISKEAEPVVLKIM